MESNYPSSWDEEESESSQSCGLWRQIYHGDETLELNFGKNFAYQVLTGYKVYEEGSDVPVAEGVGEPFQMMLEGAISLYFYATSLALITLLTF